MKVVGQDDNTVSEIDEGIELTAKPSNAKVKPSKKPCHYVFTRDVEIGPYSFEEGKEIVFSVNTNLFLYDGKKEKNRISGVMKTWRKDGTLVPAKNHE